MVLKFNFNRFVEWVDGEGGGGGGGDGGGGDGGELFHFSIMCSNTTFGVY